LPPLAARAKSDTAWQKDFASWLHRTQQIELLREAGLPLTSRPAEEEREFRIRLQIAWRERRDAERARLQQRYAPRVAALQESLRRAQSTVNKEEEQASEQKMQSMFTMGASVLGALLGRKVISASTVGRAATAARGVGRARKQTPAGARARDNQAAIEDRLAALQATLEADLSALTSTADPMTVPLERVVVKPRKNQIVVRHVVLVWVPITSGVP
jgi:hypothetical protein